MPKYISHITTALVGLCHCCSASFVTFVTRIRYPLTLHGSLSHLTSSPERYAASLGLTIPEMQHIQNNRIEKSKDLHNTLQCSELTGPQKHTLKCQHIMEYGQHPFVCRRCWTYQPICICNYNNVRVHDELDGIPVQEVIVWTHHDEWGAVANTGSVLPLRLKNVSLKLKGLPEHDIWLNEVINNPAVLPLVLWKDQSVASPYKQYSIDDLLQQEKQIVLIAVEGTWRNARRMVTKLGPMGRLALSEQHVHGWRQSTGSLRPQASSDQACTAEAVIGALVALGLEKRVGLSVLQLVEKKMDLTRQYQGHA